MNRFGLHFPVVVFCAAGLIACGARSELAQSPPDANLDAPLAPSEYKIAYWISDPTSPLAIWHSKSQSLTRLPISDPNFSDPPTFCASGLLLAVGRWLGGGSGSELDLLHADGSVAWTWQTWQAGLQGYYPDPRNDGNQLLLSVGYSSPDAKSCIATLDAGGSYTDVFCGGLGEGLGRGGLYDPQGARVVFSSSVIDGDHLDTSIDVMRNDGSNHTVLVSSAKDDPTNGVSDASFSFDGRYVLYLNCFLGGTGWNCEIDAIDINTRVIQVIAAERTAKSSPRFTPDGTGVVFLEQQPNVDGVYSIREVDVATGVVTTLLQDSGSTGYLAPILSVAPDTE